MHTGHCMHIFVWGVALALSTKVFFGVWRENTFTRENSTPILAWDFLKAWNLRALSRAASSRPRMYSCRLPVEKRILCVSSIECLMSIWVNPHGRSISTSPTPKGHLWTSWHTASQCAMAWKVSWRTWQGTSDCLSWRFHTIYLLGIWDIKPHEVSALTSMAVRRG